ncbi:MAG: hypothetical protein P8Z81_15515 [Deinococcales bacterium]
MDERLRRHTPSAALRSRAEAEGIDLEALKREAPADYMVLNAGEVLLAAAELAHLDDEELERFDALLAPLVDRPEWSARHAYYREVNDARGKRRELGLPLVPDAYREGDAVVGPFPDEAAAEAWGREHVDAPRVHDPFAMNGRWFCDVFRADEG